MSETNRQEPPTFGEFNGFEVYPMPFFVTIVAADPAALARWYESTLGFGTMFAGPVIHLRRRRYQDILVVAAGPGRPPTSGGPALTFDIPDGELDALAARAGGTAQATPWNTRELRLLDPAGHPLVFSARSENPDPEVHAKWQAMFEAQRKK
jgi:hypothetical protein